jgi:hypothetical protein
LDLLNEKVRLRNVCIVWAIFDGIHLILYNTSAIFRAGYSGPEPTWAKVFLLVEAVWVILAACLAISAAAKAILDRSVGDKDRVGFGLFVFLFVIYLIAYR